MSELYLVLEPMEKNLARRGSRGYWGDIREDGQGRFGHLSQDAKELKE